MAVLATGTVIVSTSRFGLGARFGVGACGGAGVGRGLTSEAARWLWATFLAVVSSGWASVASWWNS